MYMLHNFYYVNAVINFHIQTSVAQLAKASSCPFHVQHKLWSLAAPIQCRSYKWSMRMSFTIQILPHTPSWCTQG